MRISQITGIRFNDSIDVFVTQKNGCLKHYYANPSTNWISQSRILLKNGVIGKPAAIRHQNQIDVFVLTHNGYLLHFWWSNENHNLKYKSEIIAENVSCPPVALRWENEIDIYFFNHEIDLIHLWTSNKTNWIYQSEILTKSTVNFGLTALRTNQDLIDVYFISENRIIHLHTGQHNKWKYEIDFILPDIYVSLGSIQVTRSFDTLNLFYFNENNQICQAISGSYTNGKYLNIGPILNLSSLKLNEFSVIEYEKNIDIYYIAKDNCVHHSYFGPYSNFKWESDEIISASNAYNSLIALRPNKKAIDIYYLDKNDQLHHLFIGEGTGHNWDTYQTDSQLPVIDWKDLNNNSLVLINENSSHCSYLIENIIVKKFKTPNTSIIRKEATILDKISIIWNSYFKAYLFENNNLVGFAMSYFKGRKLDSILQDKDNVFHKKSSSRIELIKNLSYRIHQIQKLGICHGNINLKNIIIRQERNQTNESMDVILIDFSNAIFFNSNSVEFSLIRADYETIPFRFLVSPEFNTDVPFDPSGINAYQLAKVSMQILMLTYNQEIELKNLQVLGSEQPFIEILTNGFNSDICKRNKIFEDIRNLEPTVLSQLDSLINPFNIDWLPQLLKHETDWETTIRKMLETIIETIPKYGTLFTSLFQYLWPLTPNTKDIYEKIKDISSELIDENLLEIEINKIKNDLNSIKSNMIYYVQLKKDLKPNEISFNCGIQLSVIIDQLNQLQIKLIESINDIHNVRLTITCAFIHLTALREHYRYGDKLFKNYDNKESLKNMEIIFENYKLHFEQVYPKWKNYRKNLIDTDYEYYDNIKDYNVCEAKKKCKFNEINAKFVTDYLTWYYLKKLIPGYEDKLEMNCDLATIEYGPYFENDYFTPMEDFEDILKENSNVTGVKFGFNDKHLIDFIEFFKGDYDNLDVDTKLAGLFKHNFILISLAVKTEKMKAHSNSTDVSQLSFRFQHISCINK
jgi:hypothetical protein